MARRVKLPDRTPIVQTETSIEQPSAEPPVTTDSRLPAAPRGRKRKTGTQDKVASKRVKRVIAAQDVAVRRSTRARNVKVREWITYCRIMR